MKFSVVRTDLGWIGLAFSDRGLRAATLPTCTAGEAEEQLRIRGASRPASENYAGGWPDTLRRYARGEMASPAGELDLAQGTPFQRDVWRALLDIPCGQTRTYGQIAAQIGRPRAARAVGQAVGANPLPIVIPCHRVVATSGLGGFGGGLEMKRRLLQMEKAPLR